jgi:hypothetical protein
MPVGSARAAPGRTSPIRTGPGLAVGGAATGSATTSSTSVFHSPQDEHCPAHLGCAAPQSEQT